MSRSGPRYIVLLCALLGIVAVGGCGKKGPLYLPDDASASRKTGGQVTMPAPAQPPK
jgi:predicted small lipoprotein YifL